MSARTDKEAAAIKSLYRYIRLQSQECNTDKMIEPTTYHIHDEDVDEVIVSHIVTNVTFVTFCFFFIIERSGCLSRQCPFSSGLWHSRYRTFEL